MSIQDHDDLRQALDTLAEIGAASARPEALLGTVRGRVRRRRALKQVGVGATTLAVGGALAVGALQLVPRQAPGTVGPAQSPTVTAPPSETPSPATSTPPAPTPGETSAPPVTPAADCSAAGLSTDVDLTGLTPEAQQTVQELLTAAVTCDADALITLAQADGTFLNFGGNDPVRQFTLPAAEDAEPVYEILVHLITQTTWAPYTVESANDAFVWPLAADAAHLDDDAAWQEAIDAGAVSAQDAALMRSGEGYLGWRMSVRTDGTWQFFTGGD